MIIASQGEWDDKADGLALEQHSLRATGILSRGTWADTTTAGSAQLGQVHKADGLTLQQQPQRTGGGGPERSQSQLCLFGAR